MQSVLKKTEVKYLMNKSKTLEHCHDLLSILAETTGVIFLCQIVKNLLKVSSGVYALNISISCPRLNRNNCRVSTELTRFLHRFLFFRGGYSLMETRFSPFKSASLQVRQLSTQDKCWLVYGTTPGKR